jgi:hypothetical protein
MRPFHLILLLGAVSAGCAQVAVSAASNGSIQAQFTATPENDGTTSITGVLKTGDAYITLEPGDRITVTSGTDTAVMAQHEDFWGATSFQGSIPADNPDEPISVALVRANDETAARSVIRVASHFDLAPIVVAAASRESAIHLVWNTPAGAGETMNWSASGDCINSTGGSIPAGALRATIAGGTLKASDPTAIRSCSVSISVSRSTTGSVSGDFAPGSSITSVRTFSNSLTLKP